MSNYILPPAAVIERAAIAGRARARKRATDALLAGMTEEQLAKLDRLLVSDGSVGMTPFAWLKAMPIAPKADHVGELLDLLPCVREIGLQPNISERVAAERQRQFVREGYAADAHQLGRYTAHRRRAILIATAADLENRLTDAVLDMADKLIGGMFAKARNATRQRYVASAADIRSRQPREGSADSGLPASADEWLASRRQELDNRLRRFAESLRRGTLAGVEMRDGQLHVTPVKASAPPDARSFADRVDALLPAVRITELLHDVNLSDRLRVCLH